MLNYTDNELFINLIHAIIINVVVITQSLDREIYDMHNMMTLYTRCHFYINDKTWEQTHDGIENLNESGVYFSQTDWNVAERKHIVLQLGTSEWMPSSLLL